MLKWLGVIFLLVGLGVTACGAGLTASGVIIKPEQAQTLATMKWDENSELKEALLDQSNKAWWGLILIVVGTVLQIVGTFLTAFWDAT